MRETPTYLLQNERDTLRRAARMLRGVEPMPIRKFVSYQYGKNIAALAWLIENPKDDLGAWTHHDVVGQDADRMPQLAGLAALYWIHPHHLRQDYRPPTALQCAQAIEYYLAHGDPHWESVFTGKTPVTVRYDDAH